MRGWPRPTPRTGWRSARDALASLQNVQPLKEALERAELKVADAAKDVIRDETQHWHDQIHQLHQHYIASMAAYNWLCGSVIEDLLPKIVGTQ
jgi:hypothetical protein